MSTHPSSRASRRPSLSSLFRFLAEWTRPYAPVVRPRIRPHLEILEARTVPTLLHVTSLADDSTAGTLRSIIATANTNADTSNTIVFDLTGMIDLKLAPLNPLTPPGVIFPGPTAFDVKKPLTIIGSGQTITRDATAAKFRLFFVEATGNLSLSNLTLSNGLAQGFDGSGGGGGAAGLGGAIYNRGTLSVQGVTFTGDAAIGGFGGTGGNGGDGGGLGSNGLSDGGGGNPNGGAGGYGGGAAGFGGGGGGNTDSGSLGGKGGFGGGGSSVSGGSGGSGGFGGGFGGGGRGGGGGAFGGAIFSEQGPVSIINSTLFGNSVTGGAGASGNGGTSGNGASGFGGAVFGVDGKLTITNSTLSGNTVTAGAGGSGGSAGFAGGRDVYITANLTNTSAVINNSILGQTDAAISDLSAGNVRVGPTISSSGGNNLIRNPGSGARAFGGASSNADPMLDPAGLKDNGGLTPTIALLPGSPAIDAGSNSVPNVPTTDQRGFTRPDVAGTKVDIGAFEVQQQSVQTATITSLSTTTGFENSTFIVVINGSGFAQGATVTFGGATLTPTAMAIRWRSFSTRLHKGANTLTSRERTSTFKIRLGSPIS